MSVDTLIHAQNLGDAAATSELLEELYAELHRIARRRMAGEKKGHLLQTPEHVGEAYLRLCHGGAVVINDKKHFLSLAAETMRNILIDHANRMKAKKRGGGAAHVTLDDSWLATPESPVDLLELKEALDELKRVSPRQVQVLDLRFFVGFSVEETAELLQVSEKTIKNDTQFAKAWLHRRLSA
jgi:RNA polymerase sigma factor (TIGR02999 family)